MAPLDRIPLRSIMEPTEDFANALAFLELQ